MTTESYPQLTDEMFEAARASIRTEYREQPACFSVLTKDVIRRWAYAIGDANPLWLDEEYARKTRWGALLSPPTFPETAQRGPIFNPLNVPRVGPNAAAAPEPAAPTRRAASRGSGFPGIGALQVGRQFTFYRPVRVNTELVGMRRMVSIIDSNGRVPGDSIEPESDVKSAMNAVAEECAAPSTRLAIQTLDIKIVDKATGEPVLRDLMQEGRFARGIPMEISKYRDLPLPKYTSEDLASITAQHEREFLRGSDVLYWEDVKVGDELPSIVKGPQTPSDYILYHSAFGTFYDVTDRIKYLMLSRFPGAAVVDPDTGVPDLPFSMHLNAHTYHALGYPRGFDGSMQRISWFGHLVTNWMGDDAFLRKLNVFHRRPLFLYDAMWLYGRVASKNEDDCSVTITLWGINQRDEQISHGTAEVVLQNRSGKVFPYS